MRRVVWTLLIGLSVLGLSGCGLARSLHGAVLHPACIVGTYQLDAKGQPVGMDTLDQTLAILRQRLGAAHLSSFDLLIQPPDTIVVHLSDDGTETDSARRLIAQQGTLEFVAVPAAFADQVVEGEPLPRSMPVEEIVSQDQISAAHVIQDQGGGPAFELEFNSAGAAAFDEFAAKNFGGDDAVRFAIVLDGIVQSALTLRSSHYDGSVQITGNFQSQALERLATIVQFGALPLPVLERSYSDGGCAPRP